MDLLVSELVPSRVMVIVITSYTENGVVLTMRENLAVVEVC